MQVAASLLILIEVEEGDVVSKFVFVGQGVGVGGGNVMGKGVQGGRSVLKQIGDVP